MKQLLLFTFLFAGLAVQAEPLNRKKAQQLPEHYRLPEDVVQQQSSRLSNKPTATQKRLIATSYRANGMRQDSTAFIYNNNVRGSVHTTFNSYYTSYSLLSSSSEQYIKCDTTQRWYNNGSGSLDLISRSVFVYNSQQQVILNDDIYSFGFMRTEGTYGTGNRLTEVTSSDTFGGTGLIPKRRTYIFYDGQGRRTMDSAYNLVLNLPDYKRMYFYDTKGNLDSFTSYSYSNNNTWELSFRTTYEYDAANRVVKTMYEGDYGTGFDKQSRDSFAYAGTFVNPVYHLSERWDGQAWEPSEILEYSLNTNGLPSFYIVYRYTQQWDTLEMNAHGYDANGLLIQSNGYRYLGNGVFATAPYDHNGLYYEEHDPSSVGNAARDNNIIAVYPNPASTSMTIAAKNTEGEIRVVNIKGQTMYTGRMLNNATTVDVSSWAAGTYCILFADTNGHTLSTTAFVKQ